jgi:hypothetical protein
MKNAPNEAVAGASGSPFATSFCLSSITCGASASAGSVCSSGSRRRAAAASATCDVRALGTTTISWESARENALRLTPNQITIITRAIPINERETRLAVRGVIEPLRPAPAT